MFKRIVRKKLMRRKNGATAAQANSLAGDKRIEVNDFQSEGHVFHCLRKNENVYTVDKSHPIGEDDSNTAEKGVGLVEKTDVKSKLQMHPGKKRKMDASLVVEESDEMKGKKVQEVLGNDDHTSEDVDMISQLPDHIICHILTFIPNQKDVVRTSILSKRWRHVRHGMTILKFDLSMFLPKRAHNILRTRKFKDYVYKALQTHIEQNACIHKLVLRMAFCHAELFSHLDSWIKTAIENGLRELDLYASNSKYPLDAPTAQTIFNVKTLTGLRLCRFSLHGCDEISLPHLQKICLGMVHINHHFIQKLVSSCPAIKDLRLIQCRGLRDLHVASLPLLERVEVHHCMGLKTIEINATNLETFWYYNKSSGSCKLNLTGCPNMKRLTLESVNVSSDVLNDLLRSFPLLEKLDLSKCNKLKNVMVFNEELKRLSLRGCVNVDAVWTDCPLEYFEYRGEKTPILGVKSTSLTEAKLHFAPAQLPRFGIALKPEDICWFSRIGRFIKTFDPSKQYKLVVSTTKNFIIHEDLNEVLLPPVRDLRLEIIKPSASMDQVLDYFMRIWHPKTLSVVSHCDSQVSKLVHMKLTNIEEKPLCCQFNTHNNKCWKHFIVDATLGGMGTSEVAVEAAKVKKTFDWLKWLNSSNLEEPYKLKTYTLRWNYEKKCRDQEQH